MLLPLFIIHARESFNTRSFFEVSIFLPSLFVFGGKINTSSGSAQRKSVHFQHLGIHGPWGAA